MKKPSPSKAGSKDPANHQEATRHPTGSLAAAGEVTLSEDVEVLVSTHKNNAPYYRDNTLNTSGGGEQLYIQGGAKGTAKKTSD